MACRSRLWGLSGELLQLCDHRAIPKEKPRAKPHTKCKQLGHGRHPSHWVPTEEAWAAPSSSVASKLWLSLSIRHKRQVRMTPPQAGVQGWASQPCFFPYPRVLPGHTGPPCSRLPLVMEVPAAMANPGTASCWVGSAGEEGGGRVTGGHRKERSTRMNRTGPAAPPLSSPSVLEAPPGFWWGELIHVSHLVVGLVTHSEDELVSEANLLLGHKWHKYGSQNREREVSTTLGLCPVIAGPSPSGD